MPPHFFAAKGVRLTKTTAVGKLFADVPASFMKSADQPGANV